MLVVCQMNSHAQWLAAQSTLLTVSIQWLTCCKHGAALMMATSISGLKRLTVACRLYRVSICSPSVCVNLQNAVKISSAKTYNSAVGTCAICRQMFRWRRQRCLAEQRRSDWRCIRNMNDGGSVETVSIRRPTSRRKSVAESRERLAWIHTVAKVTNTLIASYSYSRLVSKHCASDYASLVYAESFTNELPCSVTSSMGPANSLRVWCENTYLRPQNWPNRPIRGGPWAYVNLPSKRLLNSSWVFAGFTVVSITQTV